MVSLASVCPSCPFLLLLSVAKARGEHIRVHYKHCREIAKAINGQNVGKAKAYLENVLLYKEAIPITKYTGGTGRHAQAKQMKVAGDKVAWPQKATKVFLDLLTNIQSNAAAKGLDLAKVSITHANCNQAPKMRRRTYRAHGRINAYMSSPAHIQLIAEEANDEIVKEAESVATKLSKKQVAQGRAKGSKRVPVGGGN
jgi:large subunit ribosomal protein L17e